MRTMLVALSLSMSSLLVAVPSNAATENSGKGKSGSNQGLTLDDIGRGLKSAAKNIEEEIPKVGPAISDTFKKVRDGRKEDSSAKASPQHSSKDKK